MRGKSLADAVLTIGTVATLGISTRAWQQPTPQQPAPPPATLSAAGTAQGLTLCPAGGGRGGPSMAECGDLPVFENRVTRAGRQIKIHFMVFRADQQPAHEAVFMFGGGPGEGSTSMAGTANGWAHPLRSTMDIVLVDQRGTGSSNPLPCVFGSPENPQSGFGAIYPRDRVRQCRVDLEKIADLTQYTTDIAVADVEDVRAKLGYDKVVVYGGSYGTRMAQAYMRRYPARTKASIIDGVVPFDNEIPLWHAKSAQQAIDRVFEACAATPACQTAHPHLADDFQTLLHKFDGGPLKATVTPRGLAASPVMITRNDFGYAVRGIMYNGNPTNTIADLIGRAVASGDMSEFAQRYFDRQQSFNRLTHGLHLSIMCPEDIVSVTDEEVRQATANTFLGSYVIDEYRAACKMWPIATLAPDFRSPVTVRVPTLLVSGHFDPVTPQQYADRIAKSLPLALEIVSPTTAHGSASRCPLPAVLQVMRTGSLEGLPEVCK
jgi:pimeloyl-ACP methyl ester carboxylesterase